MRIINIAKEYEDRIRNERHEREEQRKRQIQKSVEDVVQWFETIFVNELEIMMEAGIKWRGHYIEKDGSFVILTTDERAGGKRVKVGVTADGRFAYGRMLYGWHAKDEFMAYLVDYFDLGGGANDRN